MPKILRSPERTLNLSERDELIRSGGYTHELFQVTSSNPTPPFPGEALLLFAGGLVEQTVGLPEGIIAMVEVTQVTFPAMAIPPVTVHVDLTIDDPIPTPSGTKVIWPMHWIMCSDEATYLTADVKMLGTR